MQVQNVKIRTAEMLFFTINIVLKLQGQRISEGVGFFLVSLGYIPEQRAKIHTQFDSTEAERLQMTI